jgi:hypothetical protein
MAAEPVPAPDDLTARPLGPRDGPLAWRFLWQSGVRDVFVAAQLWSGGLEHRLPDGMPEFHGVFAGSELRTMLFFGLGGLAMPTGDDPRALAELGPALARRAPSLRALVGSEANVDVLRPFVTGAGARARVDVREIFMEVDGATLDPEALEPELRPARLEDLDAVARASSRAHLEEMGDDPMARNPEAFLGRVARLILEERVFVVRRGPALAFKAELSALCPLGAQIAGVYTEPQFRNQGLARRGTAEVARLALATTPSVCLYVREDNAPARRAYERGGFRATRACRTMIFSEYRSPFPTRSA